MFEVLMEKMYTTEDMLITMAKSIIDMSNTVLLKSESPNKNVVQIIRQNFMSILKTLTSEGKVIVLNPQRDLQAARIIIDSADFEYDSELFGKVFEFKKICEKLPKDRLLFEYKY